MSDQKLNVQLTIDTSGMVKGLSVATDGVVADATRMRTSFSDVGAAASQSSQSFTAFSDKLAQTSTRGRDALGRYVSGAGDAAKASTALKDEAVAAGGAAGVSGDAFSVLGNKIKSAGTLARSQGRFGSFIARDIAQLIPVSNSAASAVAGLVSGIAYGSGIGIAISAVRLLVAAFKDGDAVEKFSKSSAATLTKMKEQVADIVATMNGEKQSATFGRKSVGPLEALRDQQKQAVDDAQKRLADGEAIYQLNLKAGAAVAGDGTLSVLQKKVDAEKALLAVATSNLNVARQQQALIANGDALNQFEKLTDAASKYGSERTKVEQQVQEKIAHLETQTVDGNEKIEAEYLANLVRNDLSANLTIEQHARLNTATLMAYRHQLTEYAKEQAKEWAEQEKKWIDANVRAQRGANEAIKRDLASRDAYQLKRAEDVSRQEDERSRKQIEAFREESQAARQFGDMLGNTFGKLASGSESGAKAFADLASAGVKAFFDLEIKAVEAAAVTQAQNALRAKSDVLANAADASSGAAASQASIPFIGPILAVTAMAAMEAAVLGLLSLIPSASSGFDIPNSINPVTQLHGGEMVLPKQYADVVRGMAGDGGGGGVEVHMHFHAGSVVDQQSLDRHIESPAFQRSVARAVRKGAWRG